MEIFGNPWVIGIGTTIIAGLVLYFIFGIGKAKPHDSPKQVDSQAKEWTLQSPSTANRLDITPEDIFNYLKNVPPLQREIAAKNYVGIKVSWRVKLNSSFVNDSIHYLILAHGRSSDVLCQVDLGKYPNFKIMKKGEGFQVDGTISSVDSINVNLTDCTFTFGHE